MELDWQEGVFFDSGGHNLLCSTHGAQYDTRSGRCLGGPCDRPPLVKLKVEERAGGIYFTGFADGGKRTVGTQADPRSPHGCAQRAAACPPTGHFLQTADLR